MDLKVVGNNWHIHVIARRASQSAVARAGHGWVLRDQGGQAWLTAVNVSRSNHRLVGEMGRKLENQEHGKQADLRTAYQQKKNLAERLQREGQARLNSVIGGLRFLIQMEPFSGVAGDQRIATKVIVTPNTEEQDFEIPLPTSFSHAPGGLSAHEGHTILTAAKPKEIHLLTRHGETVTGAMLKQPSHGRAGSVRDDPRQQDSAAAGRHLEPCGRYCPFECDASIAEER